MQWSWISDFWKHNLRFDEYPLFNGLYWIQILSLSSTALILIHVFIRVDTQSTRLQTKLSVCFQFTVHQAGGFAASRQFLTFTKVFCWWQQRSFNWKSANSNIMMVLNIVRLQQAPTMWCTQWGESKRQDVFCKYCLFLPGHLVQIISVNPKLLCPGILQEPCWLVSPWSWVLLLTPASLPQSRVPTQPGKSHGFDYFQSWDALMHSFDHCLSALVS